MRHQLELIESRINNLNGFLAATKNADEIEVYNHNLKMAIAEKNRIENEISGNGIAAWLFA